MRNQDTPSVYINTRATRIYCEKNQHSSMYISAKIGLMILQIELHADFDQLQQQTAFEIISKVKKLCTLKQDKPVFKVLHA